jgi:hypothetical protein
MINFQKKYFKYKQKYIMLAGALPAVKNIYDKINIPLISIEGKIIDSIELNKKLEQNDLDLLNRKKSDIIILLRRPIKLINAQTAEYPKIGDKLINNDYIQVIIFDLPKIFPSKLNFAILQNESVTTRPKNLSTMLNSIEDKELLITTLDTLKSDITTIYTSKSSYSFLALNGNNNIFFNFMNIIIKDNIIITKIIFFNDTDLAILTNEKKVIFFESIYFIDKNFTNIEDIYNCKSLKPFLFLKQKNGNNISYIFIYFRHNEILNNNIHELENFEITEFYHNFALTDKGTVIKFNLIMIIPEPVDISLDSVILLLTNVKKIIKNLNSYAALKTDGNVITWGYNYSGGNSDEVKADLLLSKCINIFCTKYAFAALCDNGKVITWGDKTRGGKLVLETAFRDKKIKNIYSTNSIFIAYFEDNTIAWWGDFVGSYPNQIKDICTSKLYDIFIFLTTNNSVLTIDNIFLPKITTPTQLNNYVDSIYSNGTSGFAAIMFDGSVITWGYFSGETIAR